MSASISYRLERPGETLALRGLRLMMGGAAAGQEGASIARDLEMRLEGFLEYAHLMGMDIRRQVIAQEMDEHGRTRLAGMCLWVPAPGKTASLFSPNVAAFPETARANEAAIPAALEDARRAGVVLVQVLIEPEDAAGREMFAHAGFSELATLIYMERKPPTVSVRPATPQLPPDITILSYDPTTHPYFAQAIAASYQQTLDCPGLAGLRDVEDVIEGHKSVGLQAIGGPKFDPLLWGVLMQSNRPVGCMMLAEIAARKALELVYLGLAPEVRGRGLGRLMVQRLLNLAARRNLALATLAVDAANEPALRLYRRCGYSTAGQRIAMIRKL